MEPPIARELDLSSSLDRALLAEVFRLRVSVWVAEGAAAAAFPAGQWRDDHDDAARHWVVLDERQPIAAARLTVHESLEAAPSSFLWRGYAHPPAPVASLNRLVVERRHRYRRIATALDRVRIDAANELGCASAIACAPRSRAERLQHRGWTWLGKARNEDHPTPLTSIVEWIVLAVARDSFVQVR